MSLAELVSVVSEWRSLKQEDDAGFKANMRLSVKACLRKQQKLGAHAVLADHHGSVPSTHTAGHSWNNSRALGKWRQEEEKSHTALSYTVSPGSLGYLKPHLKNPNLNPNQANSSKQTG